MPDRDDEAMSLMGVSKFERFFRAVAGVDVDKDDLKRYNEFVQHKIYDFLLRGQAVAKANIRDIIEPWDLPITKGLQVSINEFKKMNEEIELLPILERLAGFPQLEIGYSQEIRDRLPMIAGGLSVALARTFTIIDPAAKKPHATDWEQSFRLFDLLL